MLLQFILCKYIRVVWRAGPDSSLFLSTLLLFKTRQQKIYETYLATDFGTQKIRKACRLSASPIKSQNWDNWTNSSSEMRVITWPREHKWREVSRVLWKLNLTNWPGELSLRRPDRDGVSGTDNDSHALNAGLLIGQSLTYFHHREHVLLITVVNWSKYIVSILVQDL